MDAQRRTLSVDAPERKYQLVSMASIKLFAESEGYVVNDDVIRMLSEDVNYRVRELVSEATQYLKHSHRTKLTVSDIKHAMEDANVQHVTSGLETVDTKDNQFITLHDVNIHIMKDSLVDLKSVVHSNEPNFKQSSLPLCIEQEWLNTKTHFSQPSRALMECLSRYFTEITESLVSTDSQIRQLALADLICNPRVSYIKEQIVTFSEKWCLACIESKRSVRYAIEIIDALTNNSTVYFKFQAMMEHLISILLDKVMFYPVGDYNEAFYSDQLYASLVLCKCLRDSACNMHRVKIIELCVNNVINQSITAVTLTASLMLLIKLDCLRLVECTTDPMVNHWIQSSSYSPAEKIRIQFLLQEAIESSLRSIQSSSEASNSKAKQILTWSHGILEACNHLQAPASLSHICVFKEPIDSVVSSWARRKYMKRVSPGRQRQAVESSKVLNDVFEIYTSVATAAKRLSRITITYGKSTSAKTSEGKGHKKIVTSARIFKSEQECRLMKKFHTQRARRIAPKLTRMLSKDDMN